MNTEQTEPESDPHAKDGAQSAGESSALSSDGVPAEAASGEAPATEEEIQRAALESAAEEIPEEFKDAETMALVARAQEGEVDALNRLFSRYHGYLVEQARRRLGPKLRAKEEPDDLAQTTFREATRDFKSYSYRGEGSLLRWLVQILQNKIRDKAEFYTAGKRDFSRERALEDPGGSGNSEGGDSRAYEPQAPDPSVTSMVSRHETFGILRRSLERLSDDHRRAITLVFFEGLSLREAGARMDGRSEDAVRMMLRRAEGKLREMTRTQIQGGAADDDEG